VYKIYIHACLCGYIYKKCSFFKILVFYFYGFSQLSAEKCGVAFLFPCDFEEVRISVPHFPVSSRREFNPGVCTDYVQRM